MINPHWAFIIAKCFWEATFSYESYHLSACYQLYISCKINIEISISLSNRYETIRSIHYKTDDGYSCNHAERVTECSENLLFQSFNHFLLNHLNQILTNESCFQQQMLEENYQNSEYILSTPQNLRTGLALERKVCEPWEKLDKYKYILCSIKKRLRVTKNLALSEYIPMMTDYADCQIMLQQYNVRAGNLLMHTFDPWKAYVSL